MLLDYSFKSFGNAEKYADQNSPEFESLACFHLTISGNFEGFQYFNLEIDFLKNENIFQKAGGLLLNKSSKIENSSISYKTATREAK